MFRVIAEPLAVAILLALAVRTLVEFCEVPSESMAPTLRTGDHILVTPYRFGRVPRRGDVVVFRSPVDSASLLVKRVIGIPGDLVESHDGVVSISGHPLPEPYLGKKTVTDGVSPAIVPAGMFFVLGDNRARSEDSRAWGFLPRSFVMGRARIVLWASADPSAVGAQTSGGPLRLFRRIR